MILKWYKQGDTVAIIEVSHPVGDDLKFAVHVNNTSTGHLVKTKDGWENRLTASNKIQANHIGVILELLELRLNNSDGFWAASQKDN
jgi:hypothetical protein